MRNIWTLIGIAGVLATMVLKSESAQISGVNINQNGGDSAMTFFLQNDDQSTTYDSAVLDIQGLLIEVAEAVVIYNDQYTNKTLQEVIAEWGAQVRAPPTGEVYSGWTDSFDL